MNRFVFVFVILADTFFHCSFLYFMRVIFFHPVVCQMQMLNELVFTARLRHLLKGDVSLFAKIFIAACVYPKIVIGAT